MLKSVLAEASVSSRLNAADALSVDLESNGFQRGETVSASVSYDVELGGLPLLDVVDITVSSSHSEQVDPYRSREAVHR